MKTNAPATQSRRRYRARRAAGVCTQCGHVPAEPGRPMCNACRLVTNESTRKYQRKHRIVAVVLCLCTQCCQRVWWRTALQSLPRGLPRAEQAVHGAAAVAWT